MSVNRTGIVPQSGLWMAKAQGLGNKVENSAGVAQWQLLLERIEHGN